MPATRTSIKDRLITVLKNGGNGPVGNNVYKGRQNVLPDASGLPAIYVYMLREDIETVTLGSRAREQIRMMALGVDWVAKAATPTAFEDAADTASAAIEALLTDTTLNGTCKDIVLTSADYLYDGTEENSIGRAALQYRVTYTSTEP